LTGLMGAQFAAIVGLAVTLARRSRGQGMHDVAASIMARLTCLWWMLVLSMAWNTMLVGAAVGVLLKYC
jgi:hypothetical protein